MRKLNITVCSECIRNWEIWLSEFPYYRRQTSAI